MSFPCPCEGDLGPLCRIRNLDAFLSALYFYHINDSNQNKTLPKKREGRCSALSCQLSTLKWFIVHYPLEPVAVPWEGNLWLSWGQLMAINTRGSPLCQPQRGGVNVFLPKHASGPRPTVRTHLCLSLVEMSRVALLFLVIFCVPQVAVGFAMCIFCLRIYLRAYCEHLS